jgi:hypothetical protein
MNSLWLRNVQFQYTPKCSSPRRAFGDVHEDKAEDKSEPLALKATGIIILQRKLYNKINLLVVKIGISWAEDIREHASLTYPEPGW